MKFLVFIVAVCLLAQASYPSPISDLVDFAKKAVKNNVDIITKAGADLATLEAKIYAQMAEATAKRAVTDGVFALRVKSYKDQVNHINSEREEQYGPFTDEDQKCIETKNTVMSKDIDQASTKITNTFIDSISTFTQAQVQVVHLTTQLGLIAVKNNAIIPKCTALHLLKLKDCLDRELNEVEQKIDEVKQNADKLRDRTKDVIEVIDTQVNETITTVEDSLQKDVDEYSQCLKEHLPSTTVAPVTVETTVVPVVEYILKSEASSSVEGNKDDIKHNAVVITKIGVNITKLEAKLDEEMAGTAKKRVTAGSRLHSLMKTYKGQVKDINNQREEKYGPFTNEDQECIATKNTAFSSSKDHANTEITNIFIDTVAQYSKTQLRIGHLSTRLGLIGIKNGGIYAKCGTLHILKFQECLTREVNEVKQQLDVLTNDVAMFKDNSGEINENVDKQVDDVMKTLEDSLKKEVDDYSECLIAHLPTSTGSPSTTTSTV